MLCVKCKVNAIENLQIVFDEKSVSNIGEFNGDIRFKVTDFISSVSIKYPKMDIYISLHAFEDDMLIFEFFKFNVVNHKEMDLDWNMSQFYQQCRIYFALELLKTLGS